MRLVVGELALGELTSEFGVLSQPPALSPPSVLLKLWLSTLPSRLGVDVGEHALPVVAQALVEDHHDPL